MLHLVAEATNPSVSGGASIGEFIGWLAAAVALVGTLVSAPPLVKWIGRRETAKMNLAQAGKTTAEQETEEAKAESIRQSLVDGWLDRYERRFEVMERREVELTKEVEALRLEVRQQNRHIARQDEAAQVHAGWDYLAIDALRMHKVVLADPPPLRVAPPPSFSSDL